MTTALISARFGMLRWLRFLWLLLCCSAIVPGDESGFDPQLRSVFRELERLNRKYPHKVLSPRLTEVLDQFGNGSMIMGVDPAMDPDIFSGIHFQVTGQGGMIVMHPDLLKKYSDRRSIVLSAFVHEFQHAYNYLHDREALLNAHDDDLENYLYEMDAYFLEGIFINEVLQPEKVPLTRFENILAASLEEDNLQSFSIIFTGTDNRMVHRMMKICAGKKPDACAASFESLAREIHRHFRHDPGAGAPERFRELVPVRTFCRFFPRIFSENLANAGLTVDEKNYLNGYPALKKYYTALLAIRKKHAEEFTELYHSFRRDADRRAQP